MKKQFVENFLEFTHKSKSVFHTVKLLEDQLKEKKYQELKLNEKWNISLGANYYIKRGDSALIALSIPNNLNDLFFKITMNHTDTPGFKVKPNPVSTVENSYIRFNTEVYGGPILNTWLDRPLSIAGRVLVKGDSILKPKTILFDVDRPLLVIPNVAIHQNREVNEGIKLTKQNDMLPLISLINSNINQNDLLLDLIINNSNIHKDDILDSELFLYDISKGIVFGNNNEFINSPKIDNLASTFAGLFAILETPSTNGINVLGCFDNEECGSRSSQGADSNLMLNILERLSLALGKSKEDFYQAIYNSFAISVDGAHAIHPAKTGKTDITNKPKLNNGVVIKHSANKSYSTDAFSSSIIKALAKENNIKIQEFVNHSDERGGSTLGPLSIGHLDIATIDLGIPMLSMHSIRETAGTEDIYDLKELLKSFYSLTK